MTLGAVVAALVAKTGDRAAETAVEGAGGLLRGLVERVRRRFSDTDDRPACEALELVERAPDSATLAGELAAAVDRHATCDAGFAAELTQLVERARQQGVNVESISQVAVGDQAVQIAGVAGSQINVTHGPVPPKPPT
jgi:hypothetical protein